MYFVEIFWLTEYHLSIKLDLTEKDENFRETVIVFKPSFLGGFYFLRSQSQVQGDIHDMTMKVRNLFNIIVYLVAFCYSKLRTKEDIGSNNCL